MNQNEALQLLRNEIDSIDYTIHDLLNQRAQIALRIGKLKTQSTDQTLPIYQPQREKEVLEKIQLYNQDKSPLSDHAILRIFQVIMDECRKLQQDQS